MAEAFWATPEELDNLLEAEDASKREIEQDKKPDIPDPEPAVLERAQQILDGLNKGEAFSTQSEKPAESELTEEQRLRFLAHVMEGQSYAQQYPLFGGRAVVEFQTISSKIEQQLINTVLAEEASGRGTPADRNVRYTTHLMWQCLAYYTRDGQRRSADDVSKAVDKLSREEHRLFLTCFDQFEHEVQRLLEKAQDPSFWPTR